jgi:exopolysaccharide production protein ExoY
VMALIGIAIAFTSGWPLIYSQRRVGRYGRPFTIWKFRTMYKNGERILDTHLKHNPKARTEWRDSHKLLDDPRIIPLGKILRQTSLDEIPQILNVLAGNMSFVGPRPIVQEEVSKYADRFACYLAAMPGITGLWQVSGRCNLPYETRVVLDERYVRRWTMREDIRIILRTPGAVFRRSGAF